MKARWTLSLPQTSRANLVQCCSTHQKKRDTREIQNETHDTRHKWETHNKTQQTHKTKYNRNIHNRTQERDTYSKGIRITQNTTRITQNTTQATRRTRTLLQGGEDSKDPLSCRSFSRQKPLNIGHFCGKWPITIRDPMSLRHRLRHRVPVNIFTH